MSKDTETELAPCAHCQRPISSKSWICKECDGCRGCCEKSDDCWEVRND